MSFCLLSFVFVLAFYFYLISVVRSPDELPGYGALLIKLKLFCLYQKKKKK